MYIICRNHISCTDNTNAEEKGNFIVLLPKCAASLFSILLEPCALCIKYICLTYPNLQADISVCLTFIFIRKLTLTHE